MSKKAIVNTTPPDDEILASKIYLIRKQKVMLDRDLAGLYAVETKVLKQSVRRNIDRFPEDFMFEMSNDKFTDQKGSQTAKTRHCEKCSDEAICVFDIIRLLRYLAMTMMFSFLDSLIQIN